MAGIAGFAGAIAPVILSLPLVLAFGYVWQEALFAGVTLAATSVSISAQVLLELGVLRTKVGNALLATALIDDVLAILLVSLAVAVSGSGGAASAEVGEIVGIVARMALYIGGAFVVAWFGLPRLMTLLDRMPSVKQSYGIPAVALLLALLFGWSAEALGEMRRSRARSSPRSASAGRRTTSATRSSTRRATSPMPSSYRSSSWTWVCKPT
ncbi:MAG: cation:proton antiporter [Anaerolineae bacterium]